MQNHKSKIKTFYLSFVLFTFTFLFLTSAVQAVNMDSSRYKIQFGNVNIGAKNESSANYKLGVTVGQDAAGRFSSNGYIVKAGFQYIHSIIPFTFTISNTSINFGTLIPSTFATGNTNLKISFGAAGNYQVTAIAEDKLKTLSNNTIDFTACDTGPCTPTNAQSWTSTSNYGFGYNMNCSGITSASTRCTPDIPADFTSTSYFRPFANQALSQTPAIVMSNSNVTSETPEDASIENTHETQMVMKLNISPIQPAGTYQTIINFVATPSY
ncbi:MAG TPA: hypothetical protein VK338_04625 [Candidatus Nitrosocosmicus sp.]|nr:hypothetical protein [Candidatus Nitrosocosmicus sp.]